MKIEDVENLTKEEIDAIYDKCIYYISNIKNPSLRRCCLDIYSDYKEKLVNKPATKDPCHHFYYGGLLYHSYCVARNAITIAKLYYYVKLDLDLIIFGALLHDIGKTNDYLDFNDIEDIKDGRSGNSSYMVGHSYEGCHIVEMYLDKYDLDKNFKYQVLHMIGSHMKTFNDYGALTSPKMLEVIVINYADSIDSCLDKTRNGINKSKKGELYFNENQTNKFYKSLNPYYK